jgi:hypothetical protein
MAITLAQIQALINQARAESSGHFLGFDEAFYAAANAGFLNQYYSQPGNAGKSLLQTYVDAGAALNLAPSPYFNAQYYASAWPDLAQSGLSNSDLFAHWLKFGISEGRAATAAVATFDGARYLADNPDVATYVNAHLSDFLGSVSNGALAHYVKFGAAEQRVAYDMGGATIAIGGVNNSPVTAPITMIAGTLDIDTHGGATTLTKAAGVADATATGGVIHLTGDANIRIDLTNPATAIRGIDLNGDGTISSNGVENNVGGAGILSSKGITIVDAYPRNPLNIFDTTHNYTGNIAFDGTGFAGNGTTTNGNIFLGGLGSDTAFGGIGNDFLAGGGTAASKTPATPDSLAGGRNADFIFAELSALDSTDGNNIVIDGGNTADNTVAGGTPLPGTVNAAGGLGSQDNDWILPEVSDDNEPITISLASAPGNEIGAMFARNGSQVGTLTDIESVNASGNLYGFLNNLNVSIGGRAVDARSTAPVVGTTNYGIGSTGQLIVTGSDANNVVIGGYDNDNISGLAGNDLLFGGDLQFLIANKNNPNILNATGGLNLTANSVGVVFDGRDILDGGVGNDTIVYEADGGQVIGGADTGKTSGTSAAPTSDRNYDGPRAQSQGDALFLTDFSTGRLNGATAAGEATAAADALAASTTDSVVRFDLGNGGATQFKNYGGVNYPVTSPATFFSQDTTNYKAGVARTEVSGIESINATGLGTIDYLAAGSNGASDQKFTNLQNYKGLTAQLDLRGSGADNVLLANSGNDTIEGRGGDDIMSGGAGKDTFVVALGDGVDWVARPVDANGDSVWDTTGGLVVNAQGLAWGQDFRAPQAATAGTQTLIVDFGSTVLDGVNTFVATFQIVIDGVVFGDTISASTLAAAKSTAEVAAIVNASYHAKDPNVSVVATSATTIEVRAVDATPADGVLPVISTTPDKGFFVAGQASGTGSYQAKGTLAGAAGTNLEDDRLVIKSYADRSINLGLDQTKLQTTQAADLVANFTAGGSQLAQGQGVQLFLDGVREGDTVTVTINGGTFSYTAKAGDTTELVAAGLAAAITNSLDVNSAAGQVTPTVSLNSFGDSLDTGTNQAGLLLTQAIVAGSQTFMNVTATVTRTDGAGAFGSVATHNQSNTYVDLLGFDGRNGALFSQDKDASPVVLFQGRNAGTTTTSLLLTAKDAGGALNGSDAVQIPFDVTVVPAAGTAWINGDDLLYGGKGDDIIKAGTGDDRIIMSAGNDTVDGGGDIKAVANVSYGEKFVDVLQAEEGTFGTGTHFTVTIDGTIDAKGAGTIVAVGADGSTLGTTTFTNIETVRALENNRNSTLNLKALSDNVATAVGNDSLAAEGLDINLTRAGGNTYTIDSNNDGVITASEIRTLTTVLGTENITTGNANDRVTLDQTQGSANNKIDLGGQQDNTVLASLREGADVVIYDHRDINNDGVIDGADLATLKPTLTVGITGPSASTVAMTAGVLTTTTTTDTLTGVEIVDVTNAATGSRFNDTIDLSKLASGATVNYGAAEAVGKSLGGGGTPVTTVAILDANTLDSGGIALNGTLGTELQTLVGVTAMERVTGSAGDDRVIVANNMGTAGGTIPFDLKNFVTTSNINYNPATGVQSAVALTRADQGLYQYNLGAGANDTVDYKQEAGAISVLVDTTAADTDLILVDARVDQATGVERYFGGAGVNTIDLGGATSATTIQFSKEAKSNTPANEYADPAGNNGVLVDDLTRGIEVRNTTDSTVYARFMDRTGGVAPASFWTNVFGSNQAETVIFTDNETAVAHNLTLRGGANKVDYSALSATITAAIGTTQTGTVGLVQNSTANGDTISVTRAPDPALNSLSLVGSTRAGDQIDVTGLIANQTVNIATPGTPTTSQVDPLFHVVDLTAGVVTESLFGQYTPVGAVAGTAVAAGFKTFVSGFEGASNAGDADVVHLLGDGGRNTLTGGTSGDLIYGGRGTAGDGTSALTAKTGVTGDLLTGGLGSDLFLYKAETESPGGALGAEQLATNFSSNANNVLNSVDSISDFQLGVDNLGFVLPDTYNAVKVTGAIPANLATNLNSVTPLATTFTAGNTLVNITNDLTLASVPAQADNYSIDAKFAGADVTLTIADIVLRVNATSSGDVIDASAGRSATALNAASTDGLEVQVVYTAASQSQAGGFDQIIHFTSGSDKIDLSFLNLPRYESKYAGNGVNYDVNNDQIVDATVNSVRALGAAPLFSVNGTAPGLFIDAGAYKPVATQTLLDGNGDPSTTVFIDVNGDGNYVPTDDMVVVLVGVTAPVHGDFIFNQYGGGWSA